MKKMEISVIEVQNSGSLSKAVEQAMLETNSGPRALCWTPLYDRKWKTRKADHYAV